jgi:hypothetical protein
MSIHVDRIRRGRIAYWYDPPMPAKSYHGGECEVLWVYESGHAAIRMRPSGHRTCVKLSGLYLFEEGYEGHRLARMPLFPL